MENNIKAMEERAKLYLEYEQDFLGNNLSKNMVCRAYIKGATEQKEIDREEMKQLRSIMEHTASVLGIGTKWFNEDARRDAILKLKQEIFDYLSD
ncbi:hypothetical protein [Clostridium sp.]|uniref:hypothetical protein n=1 Tax=Clostridium sp. TaxID=1506 RepID=UPI0025BF1C9D|nr:hypothetical protein [Clostridium sp.]